MPVPRSRIRAARVSATGSGHGGGSPAPHHTDWDGHTNQHIQLRPVNYLPASMATSFEQQQRHNFVGTPIDYQESDHRGPFQPTTSAEVDYAAAGSSYSPALLLAPASIKSEGDRDEVITPEATFAFHEPGVLVPEQSAPVTTGGVGEPYGAEMVALYDAGTTSQADLSQYTLDNVGGVYDEGMLRGCVWSQEDSYGQC